MLEMKRLACEVSQIGDHQNACRGTRSRKREVTELALFNFDFFLGFFSIQYSVRTYELPPEGDDGQVDRYWGDLRWLSFGSGLAGFDVNWIGAAVVQMGFGSPS